MTLNYKLLTPGPLTTSTTVKETMLVDHCTWDDDYKQITQEIRAELLKLAYANEQDFTTILMQGSGTFGVESVLSSVISNTDKLLVVSNGAYGNRISDIARRNQIDSLLYEVNLSEQPDSLDIDQLLSENPDITHLAMVHSETTTGILNDLVEIAELCKKHDIVFIVDAMSSFGGMSIDVTELDIDFLISSANKCIQGVPGFSFIIAKKSSLLASRGNARTLSLDLHDQWAGMEVDGKWRFTSPTHVVLAFQQALKELKLEGGIVARHRRYAENMKLLRESFEKIGLKSYISEENQGPIIATFLYPEDKEFDFKAMYNFIKERGYAIYPGKLNGMETFRIGVIGEIFPQDITKLSEIMEDYLVEIH